MKLSRAFLCLALCGTALADHAARDKAAGYRHRQQPQVATVRVVVNVYAPSWCSACPGKVTSLELAYPEIEFRVHDQARQFPEKVANVGGVYPILWWQAAGREWYINDYSTPADFHNRWERTNGVMAQVAAMPAPGGADAGQAPTPISEVRRVLAVLRPQPAETFVDYGCGDGRWLIEAARTYGCRAVGIEIDPRQVEIARRAVAEAGLSDRVQVIEGDVTRVNVEANVGVAYLYPDLLARLKPQLLKLNRFATYMHPVDGLAMQQNGDSWAWTRPAPVRTTVQQQPYAWYGGQTYTGRVCNSPRCSMCNAIARQLGH